MTRQRDQQRTQREDAKERGSSLLTRISVRGGPCWLVKSPSASFGAPTTHIAVPFDVLECLLDDREASGG